MTKRKMFDHRPVPAAVRALQSWTAHSAPETAIALALASEEPGDWRVGALLWYYARSDQDIERIAHRLACAALLAGANAGIRIAIPCLATAVLDAMARVRKDVDVPSADKRALELRMKKNSFLLLRRQAEISLRRALEWSMARYLGACGHPSFAANTQDSRNEQPRYLARAA
jgi:hypothetical protein